MRNFLLPALLLVAAIANAQRKSPIVSPAKAEQRREFPPGRTAGLASPSGYSFGGLTSNERTLLSKSGRVPRIGVHRDMRARPFPSGNWDVLPDGTAVWRLGISSSGATGVRVQFGKFSIGSGRIWIYANPTDEQSQGPYTGKGRFGNGEFWSGTIWGDSIVIEYQPADSNDRLLPFQIRGISHRVTARPGFAVVRTGPLAALDPAASCNLDASCYPEWADAMKMVSEINFETEEDGQPFQAACSASLLATRDNSMKPYLLTAGHCINNEVDARTLETYWTYQTSRCGGSPPMLKDSTTSTTGANYLASGSMGAGDYSLLLLKDVPDGVLYAGWDAGEAPIGSNLAGIHHPMGSYKRILFGHRTADQSVQVGDDTLPPDLYYVLTLDHGIGQPGSSGSALFSAPGVVVGTLTYGPSTDGAELCALGTFDMGYGRFSVAYPNLRDWLEDLPYSEVLPSKTDVSFSGVDGSIIDGPRKTVMLTTQAASPVTFSVRSDAPWIQVSTQTQVTTQTMATSASKPAVLTIVVNPKMLAESDTYTGTVTILSGAAPPQFINVHAQMKFDISNVTASANPNPAHPASDGLWPYTVHLQESAGVSTRVTLLRIDGRDYSNSIVNWFGSDHLTAGGDLEAPLRSRVLQAPATQTIEAGGVDDSSGKNWYRVFTVSLLGE